MVSEISSNRRCDKKATAVNGNKDGHPTLDVAIAGDAHAGFEREGKDGNNLFYITYEPNGKREAAGAGKNDLQDLNIHENRKRRC